MTGALVTYSSSIGTPICQAPLQVIERIGRLDTPLLFAMGVSMGFSSISEGGSFVTL